MFFDSLWLNEEEDDSYEIDTFVIFAGLIAAFITIWLATFIDTQPTLAAKAGFELDIEGIAIAFLVLFAFLLRTQYHKDIFSFNKSPNIAAIGIGMASILPLILIQAFARVLVPGSATTIQGNSALSALFYGTAAVNETFLAQAALYTIIVFLIVGPDDEVDWKAFVLAGLLIVPGMMGFLHYAVENAALSAIIGIAMDFAFLNFLYQVTGSLTTPMVGHLSLNILSSTVASVFPLMLLGMNFAPILPFFVAFASMAVVLGYWRHKGVLTERLNRKPSKPEATLAPTGSANAGVKSA